MELQYLKESSLMGFKYIRDYIWGASVSCCQWFAIVLDGGSFTRHICLISFSLPNFPFSPVSSAQSSQSGSCVLAYCSASFSFVFHPSWRWSDTSGRTLLFLNTNLT